MAVKEQHTAVPARRWDCSLSRGDGADGPGAGTWRWPLLSLSWALHEPCARSAGADSDKKKKPEVLSGVTPG